jgi:hypothetical protein
MKSKVSVIALLVSSLVVFGFAAHGETAERKLINIAWTGGSNWSSLPYQVAVDRKFFEKEGLHVRLITMRGTALMLSADPAFYRRRGGARTSRKDRCLRGEIERLCYYLQPGD